MTTYKVTLIIKIDGGHPRKWLPETITDSLEPEEDLLEYNIEELED